MRLLFASENHPGFAFAFCPTAQALNRERRHVMLQSTPGGRSPLAGCSARLGSHSGATGTRDLRPHYRESDQLTRSIQHRQSNHSLRTVRMRLRLMRTRLTCSDQTRQPVRLPGDSKHHPPPRLLSWTGACPR